MEKRIELEKRGRPAEKITELNLDNCRSTNIVGLTDEFCNLTTLSLINSGLTTLKGFPKLPNLKKLELSDNRISNGLNYLEVSPNITNLNLSGNKLKDFEALKPLENFKRLEVLDLFNNEATTIGNYREKIFALIPSLKYLDGFDSKECEAPSEGEDDEDANGYAEDNSDGGESEDDDEEDDDDEDEEEYRDENDVSLSEVYKEDVDTDSSDWDGIEGEEEEDEEEDDDDEEDASPTKKASEPKEENDDNDESQQARGKKRKHDG